MKTTTPLLAFFLFLLFAFTTTAEVVFDSDGDLLRNGGTYKLSPLAPNGGADTEIFAAAIRKGESDACWLGVIQYTSGSPVTIAHLIRPTFVSTDFPVTLSFAYVAPNICTNSSEWVVVSSPLVGGHEPVMLGDVRGQEFGDAVVSGSFYVKPYDVKHKQYKFVFCYHTNECRNIGVHIDNNNYKRLVVTDGEPLVLKFDKVTVKESFASESGLSMVV